MEITLSRWSKISALPITIGVAVMMSSGSALAGAATGISGSTHDFSSATWNSTTEICVVCHAPHDEKSGTNPYLQGKLWNRELSSASYTMYDSTFSSSIDSSFVAAQPIGISALCLSCHDDTVALSSFGANIGTPPSPDTVSTVNPLKVIPGTVDGANLDMRSTHPISITYPTLAEDPNFNALGTAVGTSADTIQDVLESSGANVNMVQCSSCHDVHDAPNEAVASTPLLRVSQVSPASGLCLTCHIK